MITEKTITVTVKECDRCGVRVEGDVDNDPFSPDTMTIKTRSISHDYLGNGVLNSDEYLLCAGCTKMFRRFITGLDAKGRKR